MLTEIEVCQPTKLDCIKSAMAGDFGVIEEEGAPALFSHRARQDSFEKKKKEKPQYNHNKTKNQSNPGVDGEKSEVTESLTVSFGDLGLPEWLSKTCKEMGLKRPTPVQRACIPQILKGKDVLGLAQTGSGKTAAFALPILQRLSESMYGVFALVLTPTRELAFQLSDQFKALGVGLHLRCAVVIGGLDMLEQSKALMQRPHVVIATPGRIADLLKNDPGVSSVFQRIKVC
jgi:ATP-dependent RNA helicase DDX49/DBP8